MKSRNSTIPGKEKSLKYRISGLLTGSVFAFSGIPDAGADQAGLPVSVHGGGSTIGELTSPALHPTVNAGHASGVYSADGHNLTINQTTNTAILDWNSFDIASGNSVQFQQPAGTSVALNNIHQVNPSQIFGNLSANGQVYLVNANGFVFGPNSSVNTNSLVATNLNITDATFQQGIVNVVTSGAPTANVNANSATTPAAALTGDGSIYRNTGEKIRILVEKGAVIKTADTGRVILAAPEVENDGVITAPNGQVILAAATDKVYLQESSSADLRGLLVEVQTGGDVKNAGTILPERGNTTMMGFAVSQQGIVSASTSVALNGSVRLLAREGAQLVNTSSSSTTNYVLEPISSSTTRGNDLGDGLGTQAKVIFAAGSTTEVTLDESGGMAVAGQAQPKSIVDAEAGFIGMQSGSKIVTHGGGVNMTANQSPTNSNTLYPNTASPTITTDANNSNILLQTGSSIDVSGVKNVEMAMSSNIVDLTLYSYELRNDPTQKNGILYGQKHVLVDMRQGSTLADISGAVANILYSVEYRNTKAGTVNLNAEGDVLVQQGANIDISGGSLHYLDGVIQITDLVSNGMIYTMSNADPILTYQQILTESYYQAGYYQGMNAGTININSRDLVLDGNILAATVNGEYQRAAADWAAGGQLNIDTTWSGVYQQDVIFQNAQTFTAIPSSGSVQTPIYLSNALFSNGLSGLNLKTGGNLTITQNTGLTLPSLGRLTLQAGSIDVQGGITAPAGAVTLTTNITKDRTRTLSGQLHMAGGSIIDTGGLWINDQSDKFKGQPPKPLPINGGAISLQAQGDLLLDTGSKLSANGGGWLQDNLKLSGGKGGNISLTTAGQSTQGPTRLQLGAALSSHAFTQGGALSITAGSIAIANSAQNPANGDTTLYLAASQLESGGFSSYNLTANAGNLSVAADTAILLQQSNWQLNAAAFLAPSSSNLSTLIAPSLLPGNMRNPVNLSLNLSQQGVLNPYDPNLSISIGRNARITTDPKAALSLTSDANINIDGTLTAPGGNISLTLAYPLGSLGGIGYTPDQAIVLSKDAHLDAAGAAVMTPDTSGLTQGKVLDGGTISLTANRGYILMDANSSIDVSGTNAWLNIFNTQGLSLHNIASNGGTINLTASEGMVLQGRFLAQAGAGQTAAGTGSSAAGGSLNIAMDARGIVDNRDPSNISPVFPTGDRVIHVSQNPVAILDSGQIDSGVIPGSLNGQTYISASQISQGGFDRLKLSTLVTNELSFVPHGGAVVFDGDVNLAVKLSLELDAPLIGHTWSGSGDTGQAVLTTDMFTLGSSLNQLPLGTLSSPASAYHNGITPAVLNVNAHNIDLRGSGLISGFAQTGLNSSGDIRMIGVNPNKERKLIGSLSLTGELDLSAREVYPTTMTQFSINAVGGLVKILPPNGSAATPLSAGGELSINAASIDSYGNLLAPFGSINLNATSSLTLEAGSLASVSDDSNTMIPFGQTQGNGQYWVYPVGTATNILSGTPQKSISLTGPNINLQNGSVVNLNGGGDLSAYEFVPAPGGSIDYLSPSYRQSFAILPALQSGFAPYDPLAFPNSGLSLGESIYLSANAGLAAGNYVLLPSSYALLPGAYLITPHAGTANMAPGTTSTLPDGEKIVAGYLYTAGSNVSASLWSGFTVQPGSVALNYSPYQLSTASRHFSANTLAGSIPSLPQDAGNISIQAKQSLNLAGRIDARAAAGGLGGMLDISADNLMILNQPGVALANNTVALSAAELNNLGVDSILIGGLRTRNSNGAQLTVNSQSVEVAANAALQAPEIILAATDSVKVDNGASISAAGSLSRADSLLEISDAGSSSTDGALLRVSSAAQASVQRNSAGLAKQTGSLTIDSGAQLAGSGSILLDATKSGSLLGGVQMTKGQLTLRAGLITLGGSANVNNGFQLSDATLNQLHADSLNLSSYSTVNIAGALNLQLKDLTIDSAGIYGYAGAGQTASISAANITLQNSGIATAGSSASGQGLLNLQAGSITLGAGQYGLSGFSQVNLNAQSALIDSGAGAITADSNISIITPVWTAVAGANTTLNLGSHNLTTAANSSPASTSGLGARLSVNAGQINHQGRIDMASGVVTLEASQGLTIGTSGIIDTSGRIVTLGKSQVYTAGGSISLMSDYGNLNIQNSAMLNVSGSSLGGNAGGLSLSAANGTVALGGNISGHAYGGSTGGSFTLDALNTSFSGFSALNNLLQSGGFNGSLSIRQGLGDLVVAASDRVKAANITLTADTGLINVFGNLDVSGGQAGSMQLSGGDGVLIQNGAVLNAVSSNTANKGGKIVLTSDPVNGVTQGVQIASGANINVSSAAAGKGGAVQVIVNQISGNDAAVTIDGSAVHGANSMIVDAMAHYVDIPLSDTQLQQWLTDTQSYLDTASQNTGLQTRLGGFSLQPGLDIQSTSSLTWNLTAPLTGQVTTPGLFSLRSAGNVNIAQTLSDGFVLQGQKLVLQSGASWEFNIVAGADLQSANIHDAKTSVNTSALTIGNNTSVRTGSGDISLAAAGNIVLTDWTSTVYTAGQPAQTDPYASLRPRTFAVQFPGQGGDITLNAGGSIIGATTPQLMSDWLQRSGNWNPNAAISKTNLPTAWGIDFGRLTPTAAGTLTSYVNSTLGFRENIGALGGGNVTIHAGANIQDLSVMLPTTAVAEIINGAIVWHEQGGGNLNVTAGGNIAGGVFYVENGSAGLNAKGAVTGGAQYTAGPVFAMGNAQFNVSAGGGIGVGTVMNPFVVAQAGVQASKISYFTTYTAGSGINLQTLAGDVNLNNNTALVTNQIRACANANCTPNGSFYTTLNDSTAVTALLTMYPGNLTAHALSGGLRIENSMSLYSTANSSFDLKAAGDITIGANTVLNQLDVDPSQLLPVAQPVTTFTLATDYWLSSKIGSSAGHAAQPVHASDTTSNQIVSAHGGLTGIGNGTIVSAAKTTEITAALDLNNLSFLIQNINPQDVSSIDVGGNIIFPSNRDPVTGAFTSSDSGFIQVAGPGRLDIWAGGNIDLGLSGGITSVGSLYNSALTGAGAGIMVLAGNRLTQNSQPLDDFLQYYVSDLNYRNSLSTQLSALLPQPATADNLQLETDLENLLAAIASADANLGQTRATGDRLQIALNILFKQIRLVAAEANTSQGKAAYQAGYDAINRLFPNNPSGSITLDFSQIQTLAGGSIDLLAPGGMINAGLASSDISTGKTASQLGIVAQGQGNIDMLMRGDLLVNQSRVFTLKGGDITVWSSYGNIDAGRGAKSSIATQLPIAGFDAYGNLILEYPPTVSGSGIRAQSGYNSNIIGNVTLVAPAGVVDASEAGIGGRDITIAATSVIGTGNIQAIGSTFGVPQPVSSITMPDNIGNAAVAASKTASDPLEDDETSAKRRARKAAKTAIIDTQVIGFGNCSVGDIREGKQGCGGK